MPGNTNSIAAWTAQNSAATLQLPRVKRFLTDAAQADQVPRHLPCKALARFNGDRDFPLDAAIITHRPFRPHHHQSGSVLMLPLRRRNLVRLNLEEHLRRTRGGVVHLVIPGEEVKNGTEIASVLPVSVVKLLGPYLEHYVRCCCRSYRPGCFPASGPTEELGAHVPPGQRHGQARDWAVGQRPPVPPHCGQSCISTPTPAPTAWCVSCTGINRSTPPPILLRRGNRRRVRGL